MTDVLVRLARVTDSERIVSFQQSLAWSTEGKELEAETVRRGVAAVFGHPERGKYLVAELDGKLVGSLLITYEWSDWRNGTVWWIQSVFVAEEVRRKGVYRSLHEYVKALAQQDPTAIGVRLYVEKNNTIAQTTYKRLGMAASNYDLYEDLFALQRASSNS